MAEEKKEVKQEEKKEYTLLQITTTQQLKFFLESGVLVELINRFLKKAKSESTVDRIIDLIINFLQNPLFRFYVVINQKYQLVAYYIIQLSVSDDTGRMQAFIYQHVSNDGMLPAINKQLEGILISQKIEKVKFMTKRDEKAFGKRLGDDWEIVGTVFEKKLGG